MGSLKYVATTILIFGSLEASNAQQAAGIEDQLHATAQTCSIEALSRYALTSSETAEKVAGAAFDRCIELWSEYAKVEGAKLEAKPSVIETQRNCVRLRGADHPACAYRLGSSYILDAARNQFVARAPVQVFEIRASRK